MNWRLGLSSFLPYGGLAAALVLSAWSFVRSEQYRRDTDTILSQTYEIQWRSTQIRERLVRVNGYLRLASETGKVDPDIRRQMELVGINVDQLLALFYVGQFLRSKDIELLENVRGTISHEIAPIVAVGSGYADALEHMREIEEGMFEVSGTAVAHGSTMSQTAQIAIAASRNRLIFAIALGLVATGYIIIHQRHVLGRRRDQHIRSFASLFAHMTRSRLAALRLFLDGIGTTGAPSAEILSAAREAARELESINDGLLKMAYSERKPRSESLCDVLKRMTLTYTCNVAFDVDETTKFIRVPATQFHLLVDELVNNAANAVCGNANAAITVRTRLDRSPFLFHRRLVLEVIDNGVGMPSDVLEKATVPFFSTKAGSHVGLGLAGCQQLVTALGGKLKLESRPGVGTLVRASFPVLRKKTYHAIASLRA